MTCCIETFFPKYKGRKRNWLILRQFLFHFQPVSFLYKKRGWGIVRDTNFL